MPKFIQDDPGQSEMVVVNYVDQLQPGTFEYAIRFLIEQKLDLSFFYSRFKNDETGRLAYDPAILLKTALFAYSGKKHQIIVEAQAFGEGQEHHTLQPVLNAVRERFKRLGIELDDPIITADTGYANEANMQYLHEKLFFEGRLIKYRACDSKHHCMRNPDSANTRKGHGADKPLSSLTKANEHPISPIG